MRIGAAVVLVPVVLSQLPLLKLRDSNVLLSFHERPAKLMRLWLLLLMVEQGQCRCLRFGRATAEQRWYQRWPVYMATAELR